jgi:NifU-like protein involved in Fe-S cluster formation
MVTKALRDVMLAADGAGRLTGDGVSTGCAEHPVCGDRIELDCRIVAGTVVEVAWRAEGCPATMAVVAAASAAWTGQPVVAAEERIRQRLQALGGLEATESHALSMLLRALREAAAS